MTKLKSSYEVNTQKKAYTPASSANAVRNRPVVKSNLNFIDHIWASNGEIYWRSKEGENGHMSPGAALKLANRINRDMEKVAYKWGGGSAIHLKRKRDELVEKLIHAVRRAMCQREHPGDEAERLLSCAYKGLNRYGEKITAAKVFNDKALEDACRMYPYLHRRDIIALMKSERYTPDQVSRMLSAQNAKKEIEFKDPYATDTVQVM